MTLKYPNQDWLGSIVQIKHDVDLNIIRQNYTCPKCEAHTLHYLYTGNVKTRNGIITLWCDTCRQGFMLGRQLDIPLNAPFHSDESIIKALIPPDINF